MFTSTADLQKYFDISDILRRADEVVGQTPVHITDHIAPLSKGGVHDYHSSADYWWPNPDTADGLPFIQRDGESYPGCFNLHREAMRHMKYAVAHMAAAYHITKKDGYANAAVRWLKEFFLDSETRMNPNLTYAQAIPGICDGRGIGIIDTLHLAEVPSAIELVRERMEERVYEGLKLWFADYLYWMNTHPNGIEERDWHNNHAVTWWVQAAAFARFTGDDAMLAQCRERFKSVLIPAQMDVDGSLPKELARTKPYSYSCFTLDNLANLCFFASSKEDSLWEFALPDGRGIRRGRDFLLPYISDKASWPYGQDIEHHSKWPVAMSFLLFMWLQYGDGECLRLWELLEKYPDEAEVRRNMAISCAYVVLAAK